MYPRVKAQMKIISTWYIFCVLIKCNGIDVNVRSPSHSMPTHVYRKPLRNVLALVEGCSTSRGAFCGMLVPAGYFVFPPRRNIIKYPIKLRLFTTKYQWKYVRMFNSYRTEHVCTIHLRREN